MEQIEIEFYYDKEMLKRAYKLLMKKNTKQWRPLLFGLAVLLFTYIILYTPFYDPNFSFRSLKWEIILPLPLVLVTMLFLRSRIPGKWANALLKQPAFQGKMKWIITESNIRIITPNTDAQIEWVYFQKAIMDKSFILLFPHNQLMHILPTSVFKGNDSELFKSWVRKKVKEVKE